MIALQIPHCSCLKKNHYLSNFNVLSKKNIYNYLKKLFFFTFINICLGEARFSSSTSTKTTYYTRLPRDIDTRIQLPSILKIKHSYHFIVENIGIFHKNMWWVYHYFKYWRQQDILWQFAIFLISEPLPMLRNYWGPYGGT